MAYKAKFFREMMAKYGYGDCESILNEWNYVKGWKENYHHSIVQLGSQKGAAFVAAAMSACQAAPVDMLMYYDAMPTAHFNGMFDNTTLEPVKPYYAIYAWGRIAATCDRTVKASSDIPDIYVTAARGRNGKRAIFIVRYSSDENCSAGRMVTVKLEKGLFPTEVRAHITDSARMHTEMAMRPSSPTELKLRLPPLSFMLVEYDAPPPPPSATFRVARRSRGTCGPILSAPCLSMRLRTGRTSSDQIQSPTCPNSLSALIQVGLRFRRSQMTSRRLRGARRAYACASGRF